MNYYFTAASTNVKTGPMPVVTSAKSTCPSSCPLKGKGCYAESGPLAILWSKVSKGTVGMGFAELLARIRLLPKGQIWRYGQAGDLPGEGDRVNHSELKQLALTNRARPAIVFTHKPPTSRNLKAFREAASLGLHINLSANGPADADKLAQTGMSIVTVLPSTYGRKKNETLGEYRARTRDLPKHTPGGLRIAVCPATYTDVTCLKCCVCSIKRAKGVVIGFPAHSSRKRAVDQLINGD